VFILKGVKVLYFDTFLQVFILKIVMDLSFASISMERTRWAATETATACVELCIPVFRFGRKDVGRRAFANRMPNGLVSNDHGLFY